MTTGKTHRPEKIVAVRPGGVQLVERGDGTYVVRRPDGSEDAVESVQTVLARGYWEAPPG